MRYIYVNRTKETKIVVLVSENRASATHVTLGAGSSIELDYPGFDGYVPQVLTRVNENGDDISHLVMRNQETAKKSAVIKPSTMDLPDVPKPASKKVEISPDLTKDLNVELNTPSLEPICSEIINEVSTDIATQSTPKPSTEKLSKKQLKASKDKK